MKSGVRILAFDDSAFGSEDDSSLVVGVIGRENTVEGVMSFRVVVDGDDSTVKIIDKISKSRFLDQIKVIAVHGISLAGLNLVDIEELNMKLCLPVICIVRSRPHAAKLERAIRIAGAEEKLPVLKRINKIKSKRIEGFYAQYIGMSDSEAKSMVPKAFEMIRLAHMISSGISKGESKGRI